MARPSKAQIQEREALAQFGLKRCSKCQGVKPRVNFGKLNKAWDGLRPTCGECQKRLYRDNKDAVLERGRKWREANREHISEKGREYREANKERLSEYQRLYYEANREYVLDRDRRYRKANRERYRQRYQENRERRAQEYREWARSPRGAELRRQSARKYRALKASVNENFTAEDEAFVFERDGHKCVDCGITNQEHLAQFGQRLHIDHVLPLSKGHALTRENAAVRCRSCNSRKKDR